MTVHPAAERPGSNTRLLAVLMVAIATLVVVKSAWICDDAFITYRTMDNFVHGFGLVWNVGERVQSFTHPLWLVLLLPVYAVLHSAYFTGIAVSLLVTVAALCVYAFGLARSWPAILLGTLALASSRAFVDYSTSGLENPLTHLLALAFLVMLLRTRDITPRRAFTLGLLAGLGALNRLDTILLFAPALAWLVAVSPNRRAALGAVALGFLPLVAWLGFSLFYYGFPLPNTFYAKVATAVSRPLLLSHGVAYVLNAARTDHLSLLLPLAALAVAFARRRGPELAIAFGLALYLIYLVWVGGDFMSGRFFTAPLVLAVGLLGAIEAPWNEPRHPAVAWLAAAVLALGLTAPIPTLLPDPYRYGVERQETVFDPSGVSDERAFYAPTTALSAVHASRLVPQHPWALHGQADGQRGVPVTVQGSVGFYGYFAGPRLHVVDAMALTDPLLARLPAGYERPRIGHFERRIPIGYLATLESGHNEIVDPKLAKYYERLHAIVSGPLFDFARMKTIVAMNLGRYDRLIDRDAYRRPHAYDPGHYDLEPPEIPLGGVIVRLSPASHAARATVWIAARGELRATLMRGAVDVAALPPVATSGRSADGRPGEYTFSVPLEVAAAGFDAVRVEMVYSFERPHVSGCRTVGPQVLAPSDVHDLSLDTDGLWLPLATGSRLETVRVVTDPGQTLALSLLGPNAAPDTRALGPDGEVPPGSGVHLVDTFASPLAQSADRVWLRPALAGTPVRIRSLALETSPVPAP